jgi:hypothetical protein
MLPDTLVSYIGREAAASPATGSKKEHDQEEREFVATALDVPPQKKSPVLEKPVLEKPVLEKPVLEKPVIEKVATTGTVAVAKDSTAVSG